MTALAGPIVIASSGQRCGSTLLQRLVSSHPDAFIWGEHDGALAALLDLGERLRRWEAGPGAEGREAVGRDGHQSFMSNASPPIPRVDAAARAYVATLFAPPPGRPRWGFKEVHYAGPEVAWLLELFPDARIVHVTRDPRAVLSSLDAWERGPEPWARSSTEGAMRDWVRTNRDVAELADSTPQILTVRYEDAVADPERLIVERLGPHLGLDPEGFDRAVFGVRIHASGPEGRRERALREWHALEPDLRALLDDRELRHVARAYGYELE